MIHSNRCRHTVQRFVCIGALLIPVLTWVLYDCYLYYSLPRPIDVFPRETRSELTVNPAWPEILRLVYAPDTPVPDMQVKSIPPLELDLVGYQSVSRTADKLALPATHPVIGVYVRSPMQPDTKYTVHLEPRARSLFSFFGSKQIVRQFHTTTSPIPPADAGYAQDLRLIRSESGSQGRQEHLNNSETLPSGSSQMQ